MAAQSIRDLVRRVRRAGRTMLGQDLNAEREVRDPYVTLGSDYGGWGINPKLLNDQSKVFCVGVGTDVTFDLALIERFGCEVHAFDPTPKAVAWVAGERLPAKFKFQPLGLADFDGELLFVLPGANPTWDSYRASDVDSSLARGAADKVKCPVRRLETLMRGVGVFGLDLLKIDIEGGEYGVIREMLSGPIRPRQLLIEFHHLGREHRQNLGASIAAVRSLREAGYGVLCRSPVGLEISFVFGG